MGCGTSSPVLAQPERSPKVTRGPTIVQGKLVHPVSSTPCQTTGEKGTSRGKHVQPKKWQIKLDGQWKDYEDQENRILKRAYLVGQPNARFHLRGQDYEYNFRKMIQINKHTGKERDIRPPPGLRPPPHALLPSGPMTLITVGSGQPGTMITIPDPNNPGAMINVFVPPGARPGSKLAVPIPQKGETIKDVQQKQTNHNAERSQQIGGGWSTGAKVAAGGSAFMGVGAVAVGGVILGDHLAGGDLAGDIGTIAVDVGDDMGEFAADAVDWLGDAGEDVGDFIMDLF